MLLNLFLKWIWYYLSHRVHLRGVQMRSRCSGIYWKTPCLLPCPCICIFCKSECAGWAKGNPGQDMHQGGSMAGHASEQTCPAVQTWPSTSCQGIRDGRTDKKKQSSEVLLHVFVQKMHLLQGHTWQHNRHWLVPLLQPSPWVELILYLPWQALSARLRMVLWISFFGTILEQKRRPPDISLWEYTSKWVDYKCFFIVVILFSMIPLV